MLANDQSLVDGANYVKAGDGGSGAVSFREKYIPLVTGGDGGAEDVF